MKNFRATLRFSGQRWIGVSLPYDQQLGEEFKQLVAIRAWDAATKTWWFPESYEPLVRHLLRTHDLVDENHLVKFAEALARENINDKRKGPSGPAENGFDLAEVRNFDGTSGQMRNGNGDLRPAGGGDLRFAAVPKGAPAATATDDTDPYDVLCITKSAPMRLIEIVFKFWKREFDSGAPDTPMFRVEQAYEKIVTEPEWEGR